MKRALQTAPGGRRTKGFSLVELAIGLVIVAMIVSGLLMFTMTHNAVQRTQDTERLLAQARQALLGFAAVNGRLPCPAQPGLASGAAGAGQERPPTAAGCTGGQAGVLPWATLGLPELDAWGRRYTYRASALYSRTVAPRPPTAFGCAVPPAVAPAQAAFALCTPGDNQVRVSAAGAPLVAGAPAVIVSHGPNGAGAALATGATMAPSAEADEQENHDGDAVMVDRGPTAVFDDLAVWVPTSLLMQTMLQAGRLP
jgi:prepilin-type N-terminal cleavage/methylation domain-containing protein